MGEKKAPHFAGLCVFRACDFFELLGRRRRNRKRALVAQVIIQSHCSLSLQPRVHNALFASLSPCGAIPLLCLCRAALARGYGIE
jgi:hypothetical protein